MSIFFYSTNKHYAPVVVITSQKQEEHGFYSTNGDRDLAIFKIQTLLQLLLKHRDKRNLVFLSTKWDNARSVVITSSQQEEHAFSMFQADTMLQLLL